MDFYPQNDPNLADPYQAFSTEAGYTPDQLVVSGDVHFVEVYLTSGVVYVRGDLLSFDAATNTVNTVAAGSGADARFICPSNLTAAQSTTHAAGKYLLQVYSEGDFNELAITTQGAPVSAADLLAAKGALNAAGNVRLRKMT
ncbi:hypothetical protein KY49_714 [Burkholderia sp. MSHR3999]|uniref:hypothetical protein n=1 Tax=Burkholderia sp. MSHR3999 TaxID=1542965 RepID=UPI0005AC0DC7|nr:hypothetical protein [Burkholderia sp. MSHR3999]KIP14662.1 hypothetical protein KY49_714 [Burkholderia sp. MSHR3999]